MLVDDAVDPAVIDPMKLLWILIVTAAEEPEAAIALTPPPKHNAVMEEFPVAPPIMFPVDVPILALPAATYIADHTPLYAGKPELLAVEVVLPFHVKF